MGATIERLDDVAMDEVHLTTPVSDAAAPTWSRR